MPEINKGSTTNSQQIDWFKTIGFNIFIFVIEYLFVLFFNSALERIFYEFNYKYSLFLLNLVGEKVEYMGLIYGSLIKIPLIFLIFLNLLILIIWKRLPFKLYKITK